MGNRAPGHSVDPFYEESLGDCSPDDSPPGGFSPDVLQAAEERAPGPDVLPLVAELRRLLTLADACEPSSDELAGVITQIFELLLTPEYRPLIEGSPRFRATTIAKAYELSESPRLAWVTQRFLMEFHSEGLLDDPPHGGGAAPDGPDLPAGAGRGR